MGHKCCRPINFEDSLRCNISRMKEIMKLIFGMQINTVKEIKLLRKIWATKLLFCL